MKHPQSVAEGLSQHEVARRVGISHITVAQVELRAVRSLWRTQINAEVRARKIGQVRRYR